MSSASDDLFSATALPTATALNEMVGQMFPGSSNTSDAIGADFGVAGRRNLVGTVGVCCDDRSDKPTATAQGTYVLPL